MNRTLEVAQDNLTAEQVQVFEQLVAGRGRILGPYKIWIHSPKVAAGMEQIGTYLNKRGALSPREVEMGILIIATHWNADYVQNAHVREGKRVGLSDEIVNALVKGQEPPLTDPHERGVYRFAAALTKGAMLSDAEFAEIEAAIGRNGIAEVLVLLGYYTSVGLAMKIHQVPIPQQG